MDNIMKSMHIAASGMKAQSDRLRVVAENIANADAIAQSPNDIPYRRKTVSFRNRLDHELGANTVSVHKYGKDSSPFPQRYDPNHPAADNNGYISTPNVNKMIEMVDMREARRGYEANINVIEISKSMMQQTLGLLR